MKLQTLKKRAKRAAIERGHSMMRFETFGDGVARARCVFCGAWVQVEERPAPNSIDVGGTAVALNCEREKSGFGVGFRSRVHRRRNEWN